MQTQEWILIAAFITIMLLSSWLDNKLAPQKRLLVSIIAGVLLMLMLLFLAEPMFTPWKVIVFVVVASSIYRQYKKQKVKTA